MSGGAFAMVGAAVLIPSLGAASTGTAGPTLHLPLWHQLSHGWAQQPSAAADGASSIFFSEKGSSRRLLAHFRYPGQDIGPPQPRPTHRKTAAAAPYLARGTLEALAPSPSAPAGRPKAQRRWPLPFLQWQPGRLTDAAGAFAAMVDHGQVVVELVGPFVRLELGDRAAPSWPAVPAQLAPAPAYNRLSVDGSDEAVSAWYHVHLARQWLTGRLARLPSGQGQKALAWTQRPLRVRLGAPAIAYLPACGAYYDGEGLNFTAADPAAGCASGATSAQTVYHEYGHAVHHQLTASLATYHDQVSEGVADYIAATLSGEPAMVGLAGPIRSRRNLRTCDNNYSFCAGGRCSSGPGDEPHNAGPVLCGALWDLRRLLIARYGHQSGIEQADLLILGALQWATDMHSVYSALIAVDAQNTVQPDLGRGTPHSCQINAAFFGDDERAAHFPDLAHTQVPCIP